MLTNACKVEIEDQWRDYYSGVSMLRVLKHIHKTHNNCCFNKMVLYWYKLEREACIMNR